jgi:hypothetical protein
MEVFWIIGVDDRNKHPYIGVPKHHASFTLYAGDQPQGTFDRFFVRLRNPLCVNHVRTSMLRDKTRIITAAAGLCVTC